MLEQGAVPMIMDTGDGCPDLHVLMKKTLNEKYYCRRDNMTSKEYKNYKKKELEAFSLMNTLLSNQIETKSPSNPKNEFGMSHLHIACIVNHADAVEFFVKAGESLDQSLVGNLDGTDDDRDYEAQHMKQLQGYTALHCAIKYSSFKAVDILLQYGADIHIKNAKGLSCVHLLVERIMDLADFMTMGKRTLCMPHLAEMDRIESIIKLVLKTRANSEIFVDDIGFTALHLACTLRDKSIVKDFLKRKLDVNIRVDNRSEFWPGWTPIHFAACFNVETMILLMKSGADIMIENSKGKSALDLCAKRFSPADIQMILSTDNKFKDIVLSDNQTKLLDLLVIMNDNNKFSDFLHRLEDVNLIIPFNSPIWAGHNLLHLSVSLNDRTIVHQYIMQLDWPETGDSTPGLYNCTEEEEALFWKRIKLCLKWGCSVDVKNAKGQTPIHLGFPILKEKAIVEELLNYSEASVADQNDLSHLHIACVLGNLEVVTRYLSKKGANVNSRVRTSFTWHKKHWLESERLINVRGNSTPLHIAVAFSKKPLVEYLLTNEADVYATDSLNFTPIHASMLAHDKSIAQLLFRMTPNLHDCVSKVGLSHLHVAARADDREAVEKLLLQGAEIDRVIDANVKEVPGLAYYAGKTPLLVAQHSEMVIEPLLQGGANVHAKDLKGISILQYAIHALEDLWTVPLVQSLKSGKCDVDGSGISLLHFACGTYDIEWANELLKNGADVNAEMDDVQGTLQNATPLYIIFVPCLVYDVDPQEIIDLVKLLLDNGADTTMGRDGSTLLHWMYEKRCDDAYELDTEFNGRSPFVQVADFLLENQKSYNDNPVDSRGFSHFHYACVRNNVEVVKKFLDSGAGVDVNKSTGPGRFARDAGFTPLHFAFTHRSSEVAYLLLGRGADVNAKDADGNTPLHVAFKQGFVDLPLIKTMISREADVHAENLEKETIFHCLLKYGGLTLEALKFFLDCGCCITTLDVHQGIIGLAMCSAAPNESQLILERFIQFHVVKSAIQSGFHVIQSIVAIDQDGKLTLDNYFNAIKFLIGTGFELDQQDTEGKTALHKAVASYNLEAVEALLRLGANANVIDYTNKSPLSNEIIRTAIESFETRKTDVVKTIASHVWKMNFARLNVNNSNLRCLETVQQEEDFLDLLELEQSCRHELTKGEETHIDQSVTVKDFLSELGAVARYPRMSVDRRTIIEKFFKDTVHLHKEFPQFGGLLAFQYRKAITRRMELWQSSKEAIVSICDFAIPDHCSDIILKFLTNDEMKLVINLVK